MKQNTDADETMICRNCGDTATVREVFDSSGGDCEAHTFGKHDWAER